MTKNCDECKHNHCAGCIEDDNLSDYCSHGIAEAIRDEIRCISQTILEDIQYQMHCETIDLYLNELEKRCNED